MLATNQNSPWNRFFRTWTILFRFLIPIMQKTCSNHKFRCNKDQRNHSFKGVNGLFRRKQIQLYPWKMCMFCSPNFIGWTLCHRNRWKLAVETRCSTWCCPALCRGARFSKRASFSRLPWGAFRYRSNDSTESTPPSRIQRKCFRRSSQTRGFSWFLGQF